LAISPQEDVVLDFLRRVRPTEALRARIAKTRVKLSPFPHIYIRDLLSKRECQAIIEHWPTSDSMADDGAGLSRNYFELIHDDVIGLPAQRVFWEGVLTEKLSPLLHGVADAFGPWIAAKFGSKPPRQIALQIHRITCLEARESFVEHTPHAHLAAPNWVFTFLLYLDDSGREDRGTTLYDIDGLDFDRDRFDVLAGRKAESKSGFAAPFRVGALIAFLDSALSVHGSTPFVGAGSERGRRLIRAHVSLGAREVESIYGCSIDDLNAGMGAAVTNYARNGSPAAFADYRLDNDLAVLRAIADRRVPSSTAAELVFPAFG
jgi:hypothetical protein